MTLFFVNSKIVVNILWLCSEYAFRFGSGIVVTAFVARMLGVDGYGIFQFAINMVAVFAALSYICGASVLVPRLISADSSERKLLLGNAFILRAVFSFFSYCILVIFSCYFYNLQQIQLIAILGISILFSESFGVITAWLQSQTNNKPRSLLVNLSSVLKVFLITMLFYLNVTSPLAYASAWLFEPVIIAIGLSIYYYNTQNTFFFSFSRKKIIYLLKQSLPYFGGTLVALLIQRLDIIMLKHLDTEYDLGIYSAAIQLLNSGVVVFANILSISMAPILIYKYNDLPKIKKQTVIVTSFMLFFSLLIAVSATLIAPYFITLLLGKAYISTVPIFIWLAWGSCFLFIDSGLTLFLVKMNKGKLIFYKWLMVFFIMIPVYIVTISSWHALGAAIGYILTYMFASSIGCIYLWVVK